MRNVAKKQEDQLKLGTTSNNNNNKQQKKDSKTENTAKNGTALKGISQDLLNKVGAKMKIVTVTADFIYPLNFVDNIV